MTDIRMTKGELIATLKAKRAEAEKADAIAAKAHAAAEREWLKAMRARLRELSQITTYEAMVDALYKRGGYVYGGIQSGSFPDRPTCPKRQTVPFDNAIKSAEMDNRKVRTLSSSNTSASCHLYDLVTWSFDPTPRTVCE